MGTKTQERTINRTHGIQESKLENLPNKPKFSKLSKNKIEPEARNILLLAYNRDAVKDDKNNSGNFVFTTPFFSPTRIDGRNQVRAIEINFDESLENISIDYIV